MSVIFSSLPFFRVPISLVFCFSPREHSTDSAAKQDANKASFKKGEEGEEKSNKKNSPVALAVGRRRRGVHDHRLRARAAGRPARGDARRGPQHRGRDDVAGHAVKDVVRVVAREGGHAGGEGEDHRRHARGVAEVAGGGAPCVRPDDRGSHDARVQPPLRVHLGDQVLGEVLGQRVWVGEAQRLDDGVGLFGGELGRGPEEHSRRLCVREDGAVGHDQGVDGLLDVLACVGGGGGGGGGRSLGKERGGKCEFFTSSRGFFFLQGKKGKESENSGKQKLTARQEGVDVRRRHVHVPGQRRAPHRQVDRVARRDVVLLQENVHVLEERDRRGAVHDKAGAGADHVEVGGAEPAVGAADVALDGAEFGAELGAERAVFFL